MKTKLYAFLIVILGAFLLPSCTAPDCNLGECSDDRSRAEEILEGAQFDNANNPDFGTLSSTDSIQFSGELKPETTPFRFEVHTPGWFEMGIFSLGAPSPGAAISDQEDREKAARLSEVGSVLRDGFSRFTPYYSQAGGVSRFVYLYEGEYFIHPYSISIDREISSDEFETQSLRFSGYLRGVDTPAAIELERGEQELRFEVERLPEGPPLFTVPDDLEGTITLEVTTTYSAYLRILRTFETSIEPSSVNSGAQRLTSTLEGGETFGIDFVNFRAGHILYVNVSLRETVEEGENEIFTKEITVGAPSVLHVDNRALGTEIILTDSAGVSQEKQQRGGFFFLPTPGAYSLEVHPPLFGSSRDTTIEIIPIPSPESIESSGTAIFQVQAAKGEIELLILSINDGLFFQITTAVRQGWPSIYYFNSSSEERSLTLRSLVTQEHSSQSPIFSPQEGLHILLFYSAQDSHETDVTVLTHPPAPSYSKTETLEIETSGSTLVVEQSNSPNEPIYFDLNQEGQPVLSGQILESGQPFSYLLEESGTYELHWHYEGQPKPLFPELSYEVLLPAGEE